MTLPDKLYIVMLTDFRPQCGDDATVGTLRSAEADCYWLNQVSPKWYLGTTLNDAIDRAARSFQSGLRAPGYVSAAVVEAKFNPNISDVPQPSLSSGERILVGEKR